MRALLAILLCTFVSHQGFAKTVIEVSEPNFTADKIELNNVTNTYVVVNPKYFVNALEASKIAWDGVIKSEAPHTAKHLCTFLGMSGGKVISYSTNYSNDECKKTISIDKEGLYGFTPARDDYRYYGCRTIDFLECSPL